MLAYAMAVDEDELDEELDEELRTAKSLCEQLRAQIAAPAAQQQQAQEQECNLDEELDEELRTAKNLCDQLRAQIAAQAAQQQQAQEQNLEQLSEPDWDPAPLQDDEQANYSYDRCGTWGCRLPEKHSGLHQTAEPEGRRPRNPVLRYGYLPRTVPQQPNLAARRASVAALHRAEVAAEDEAEGRGDPELDDDAEDDVGAGAGHATSGTNIERVNKLRSDFIAFTKRFHHVPDDEVPPQHMTHTLPMRSSIRGSACDARDWISDYTTRESPWLCDSRLCIKDAYLASGLTSSQMNAGNHQKPGWLSAGERLQHMVRQQPSCTTVDPNTEYGRWFSPIDDAWVFGTPEERHGWRSSLVTIIQQRLSNLYNSDQANLICGTCDNPQPPGPYITPADWIKMWNQSGGKCPTCGNDMWIGYDPLMEDRPPISCLASIQRLNNCIIHLRSNCADSLICRSCNCAFH
jgi:hypothetical protein